MKLDVQALILRKNAGLLQGSRCQNADRYKLEVLGSIPSGCPGIFVSVCFNADLPPVTLPSLLTTIQ